MHTHREAWSGAASSTLCGATYTSVAIPSAFEQSVYFPVNINICIFVLHALVYKKLILAVMSTCLLVDFVVVMSKGRRWHKYVAVELILDWYNSVYPCSKVPSIRLDSSTNTL